MTKREASPSTKLKGRGERRGPPAGGRNKKQEARNKKIPHACQSLAGLIHHGGQVISRTMSKETAFLEYLKNFITPHKLDLMEEVLSKRTRYFTVVLENIYKPHNASAVLRTADCFGLQDLYIIEKENSYKINPYVTRGASQWVDLHKFDNRQGTAVSDCFNALKAKGYNILATSPKEDSMSIHDLQPEQPIALVFGNEHEGVSEEVMEQADALVHIPMYGFTESFNISVSASIFLFDLLRKVDASKIPGFYLSEEEKSILRSKWYRGLVKHVRIHEKEFGKK